MPKNVFSEPNEARGGRKRSAADRLITLALLIVVAPVVYELGLTTVGKWQGIVGQSRQVQTPVLDFLGEQAALVRQQLGQVGTGAFRTIDWEPSKVVPLACGFAALGAWFLRRGL